MALIIDKPSRTFDEYLFVPNRKRKECCLNTIDLRTPLARFKFKERSRVELNIPLASAIMQAVSGPELAIALARCGGLSFIFQSQPIEKQAEMVARVKKFKAGFVASDSNLKPNDTLRDALKLREKTGHSTIPITHDGTSNGLFLGILTDKDFWEYSDNLDASVAGFMTLKEDKHMLCGHLGLSLEEANSLLRQHKKGCLPILDSDGRLHALVFMKDYEEHRANPNQLVDDKKRLMVGAGINTWDYKERVPALLEAGVDVLCVDSSNGFTDWQKETIEFIKEEYGDRVIVGGGNVVDERGFKFLADAGADFVKVGIGGGRICITRRQTGIGVGQATAVVEVVKARDDYTWKNGIYIPICSDGSIVYDYHIALALAMGADFVMMGGWFARFEEAPGRLIERNGQRFKEYWGEGTNKARNLGRYEDNYAGEKKNVFAFEEGVEGKVPYAGKLKENIEGTESVEGALPKIKAAMMASGVLNLKQFRERAVIRLASELAVREGGAHNLNRDE